TELALLKGYEEPCWIVNGNLTSSIQDLISLCRQLKPHKVYVDGAYLVKAKGINNKWDRIAYVAESLKSDVATDGNMPVTATYQFGKDAAKKQKKGDALGLDDIYGGEVIGQVS